LADDSESDEEFPWHDPALSIVERMELAENKPIEHRLMAAMAQLDCGSCGYVCKSYAAAIARGDEADLARCSPGGKETAKKLRELVGSPRVDSQTASPPIAAIGSAERFAPDSSEASPAREDGYTRKNPFLATVKSTTRLQKQGSEKDTRHVVIDLSGSGLDYEPGDSLGVFPGNCGELVDEILRCLHCSGEEPVTNPQGQPATFRNVLTADCALTKPTPALVELIAQSAADPGDADRLRSLAAEDDGAFLDAADLLDLLQLCRSAQLEPQQLIDTLAPLRPRLYSISSSHRRHPGEVHLTVGVVRYRWNDRSRLGVCSTYLADRIKVGDPLRVFVQSSHGFRLPPPDAPLIMIGPGTGIAPFRAFLQEREVLACPGKNWLFFGDQHEATDFLYEREVRAWRDSGLLTRLDTAFSRDQADKVYVQHRLLEQAAELWRWLEQGAYLYVCGDAKRMAPDVDAALQQVVIQGGGHSAVEAKEYLQSLRRTKRYRKDVY
jgi:sulfite reductase (NADPH) flavoprotein alpha-component